jgi:3-oxoacyl-[acyl-carrier protein] reductase
MKLGIEGRVALVTGAGRGIGAVTAKFLAEEGCRLVVADVNAESAAESADRLKADGHEALGLGCDVTDEAQVARMFAAATQAFGGVDILVNNAGHLKDGSILKMSTDDWDSVVDVTLKGSFLCARAAVPHMRDRQWGRMVNLSSRSMFGNPGQTNYSAAKAGVIGFTRALALEQAKYGITVNAIAPGFIMTEGMKSLPHFEKLREMAVAKNPVGFLGEPQDVANAVLYLVSDTSRYVTGTTLFVTGGRYSS